MKLVEAESAVVLWLTARFPTSDWGTRTPSNLTESLPFGFVERIGGGDDVITIDRAVIDVETFAATRTDARTFAEAVRDAMRFELPGQTVTDHVGTTGAVGLVRTSSAPIYVPYGNSDAWRFSATYAVTIHTT